jgi:hypothetical protein
VLRRLAADALPLAALAGAAGAIYARSLHTKANFDEGVYLASLDALRHGQALGTVVNIPQPPGFYVLLQAIALLFGNGLTGARVGFLLIALLGLAAAYAVGRQVAGRFSGLAAAGLLAVAAPYPAQAAQVEADTAATVLALCSIAVLMRYRSRPWPAAGAGALAGAALSVKLLAVPVAAPLAVLRMAQRSRRRALAFAAGALAIGAALAIRYAYALGALYDSVIVEHRTAQGLGSYGDNVRRVLLHPLDWHTPAGLAIPLGVLLAAVFARRVETAALGAWIVASAAFLVYQRPLLDHHMVLIATAFAVTAGAGFGAAAERFPRPALAAGGAALGLALAAGLVQEHRRLARDDRPEPPEVRWAVSALRAHTRPDELVGTDLPIAPYLAGRRVAGQLIDSSYGRLLSGTQTTHDILEVLEREHIRAVLVDRNYRLKPDLISALRERYPHRLRNDGASLYLAG